MLGGAAMRGAGARAGLLAAALLLLAPPLLFFAGHVFYLDLLTRALILAIAALSLNLLIGYGGMISLGHAAYIGIGAYCVGIPAQHGVHDGVIHLALAIACSAGFALLTGAICLRTKGLYFLLITLAFSQMLYFTLVSIEQYGADDGLVIHTRSQFPGWPLEHELVLYYSVLAALALFLFAMHRLVHARFGRMLLGCKHNPARMQALGFDAYRHQLACYVLSGAVCGVAGFFLGNFTNFISPAMLDWTRSAELLFMVIIGGAGALCGPVIGAAAFLLLGEWLSGITLHWHLLFGALLIALVLRGGRGGLHGLVMRLDPGRAEPERTGPKR